MTVRNIVILTGAGVSAESGLATFRGPDGLWEGHRVEDVATPEAFRRDPALVHAFYDARRVRLGTVEPNAAHRALARLDAEWPGDLLLVTQNVDDLHERAGSKRLIHMHGELTKGWCLACDGRFAWDGPMGGGARCPSCGVNGQIRPDIVWFGEMPYAMERIDEGCRVATCSSRSGRRARSTRPPASSRPRAIAARIPSRSTSSRASAAPCSTRAASAGQGTWCLSGSRISSPDPPRRRSDRLVLVGSPRDS